LKRGFLLLAGLLGWASMVSAESVTSVRRALLVSRPVSGRVVAVGGEVFVRERISGDLVSWGADVHLEPGAEILGNLIVLAARVDGATARVRGRVLTPGSLASLYLSEIQDTPWHSGQWAGLAVRTGLRLLVLALWLAAGSLVVRFASGAAARGAQCFEASPRLAAVSGLLAVVILLVAGITAMTALPEPLRVPAAIAILALAFFLKVFGMTSFFLFLGQRLRGDYSPRRRPAALALGLAASGLISLVPVAGPLLWSAASVLAVGVAAFTRFGLPRFRVVLA
jgi:hypothetical protein